MGKYLHLNLIIICMFLFSHALAVNGISEETAPAGMTESFDRVQVTFIVNKGQIDNKEAAYFARLSRMATFILTRTV